MRTAGAQAYAFPARNNLDTVEREANRARDAELEAALAEAVARGHAEGLARGREEAKTEARELLESAHRKGLEEGHAAGLAEMNAAAAALSDALGHFIRARSQIVAEAETFCVDLALAIVARLVAADDTRAEFIRRTTANALKALAPEAPTAIFLSPADLQCVGDSIGNLPLREDATLQAGTARVEAGRLLVESSLAEAFAKIRAAVTETRAKRLNSAETPDVQ